ncbi:hypothetical protein GCM10010168_27080 [Actinoplanes ianthinogenes]|uniref:Tail sheath protein n=1 Tax=Actinoplanes ianthinogenes TaxID=122358 RepID=A0ABM7LKU1_9ACTN|nr:phage tail sheath subtilisin-like domain-containing protein [Actinoplanes ianthinogenes]BCJ39848.1 hypothetical protein Aiant_05050 [Actinoplanes ianthinogenes]GGR08558.1 hypothetical protein GCM10010168_27080 [Actinoplanes ianthinogenes]
MTTVPGVHLEFAEPARPASVARTDVAAFVGVSPHGPAFAAVPVDDPAALAETGTLGDTVKAFFDNGGRRCWVVRVPEPDGLLDGLGALETVDEVSLVAVPDVHWRPPRIPATSPLPQPPPDPCRPGPPGPSASLVRPARITPLTEAEALAVQRRLVGDCERRGDRVALLDPPPGLDVDEVLVWRGRFDTSYASLYHPWVRVPEPSGRTRLVAPSGFAAGVCARVDRASGVHTAPANRELSWAVGLGGEVGDAEQAVLDPAGVNCLRALPGRGIRIYGARTLATDPAWRHLPVRRWFVAVERAAAVASRQFAFQPADFVRRQLLTVVLTGLLEEQWRRGALAGATPEEAFFVRCDTGDDRLLATVGVAVVRPAEFLIFRIGRVEGELTIREEAP